MTTVLQNVLVLHVFLGLGAIALFVFVLTGLFKKKLNIKFLKLSALYSVIAIFGSWLTGGFYYVTYYGVGVKPGIKGGDFPWVHSVIMETKEHVFLFMPFLAIVILLVIWLAGSSLKRNEELKKATTMLAAILVVLGVIITLMGSGVSGAAIESTPANDNHLDEASEPEHGH